MTDRRSAPRVPASDRRRDHALRDLIAALDRYVAVCSLPDRLRAEYARLYLTDRTRLEPVDVENDPGQLLERDADAEAQKVIDEIAALGASR